jgi:SNF2 family DNA or RNA helicase
MAIEPARPYCELPLLSGRRRCFEEDSVTLALEPFVPARSLPNGELYYSPLGLYDFQVDGIAQCLVRTNGRDGVAAIWDTGIGKSHLAMGTAAYLFADNLIDLVVVIAERNKLEEWREDFERYTALSSHKYHGPGREKRLQKAGSVHVFITSYETGRNELLAYESTGSRGRGHRVDGPLVATLGLRYRRILWVFDEPIKLRKRSSENHRSYYYLLTSLRKGPHHQRVLGLTATPLERDIEDSFNIGRIIAPDEMPAVSRFDELFVAERDHLGRPRFRPGRQQVFAQMFQKFVIRKRKTDPDVIDQFPKKIEESARIPLHPDHGRLYEAVEGLCDPPADGVDERTAGQIEAQERQLYTLLRMVAGHPAAVLHSTSAMALAVVEEVGAERLRSIKSSKTEWLLGELQKLVRGQGAQVVIFTFFANTVLPEVYQALVDAGYLVSIYKGGSATNEQSKRDFKEGRTEILLASDAGARGINLENAQYVIEYESATTFANREQRLNRAHRITSTSPSVTCLTAILENTIEEGLVDLMLARNSAQDILLGDSDDGSAFVTAAQRRQLLRAYRNRRRKK